MKTQKLLPFIFAAIAIIACTNDQLSVTENDTATTFQKNWNETELTTAFYNNLSVLSHHHIEAEKLRSICAIESVVKFRFTLGLNKNQEIVFDVAGIDKKGAIVSSFSSILNTSGLYKSSIDNLEKSTVQYKSLSNATTHLLTYSDAYSYINKWENAIQKKQIGNLISYNGDRIRYFSLPKQIVMNMTAPKNVHAMALFLGLNTENKMTTVFIQKSYNGALILKKENNYLGSMTNEDEPEDGEGNIYDMVDPCPTLCD